MMNLIIFGPPGIGKGTISALLTKKLGITHIATGDILREEAKKAKNKAKQYMEKGILVPNELVSQIVKERLKKKDCKSGFILDGFPRTIAQANFLKRNSIKIDKVINVKADEEVIIGRLSGRLTCPKCNTIYHKINLPPKKEGVCDKCGSALMRRTDDMPEVIKNRIAVYKKETRPVLEHYKKLEIILDVDGSKKLSDILDDILTAL